ncbi:MAG TPA: MarR family winged helix-turn-helix transcriptional regulator [Candidatus Limiplasma sp.]|nr:MarR family winged helix-turn-helix transcriptional regulator [Candidatus Limiplasma sp.]HPS80753.1 MarR family winged helix-turn-helix transcriptional regulator [Candidatus Limiplasma sp.]
MGPEKDVTFIIRKLFNQIRRLADANIRSSVTPMQGRTIGYVKHHAGDVFQRDLEREFQIRRSTASAMLQTMERDGLIRREAVKEDARLKKLVLTPQGEAFSDSFEREMERVEAVITRGVGKQELSAFYSVAAKFEHNLKAYAADNQKPDGK